MITLRDNTERPETCTIGTNELIGTKPEAIKPALDMLFAGQWKKVPFLNSGMDMPLKGLWRFWKDYKPLFVLKTIKVN